MTPPVATLAFHRSSVAAAAWDEALVAFVHRVDGNATADELVAGVPLARRYGLPRGRSHDSTWGEAVRPLVGSTASLFTRIVEHRVADASVWIAVLRARHGAAETALAEADRPHHDPVYRAALLRFRRVTPPLLLRAAEQAHGQEFDRFARYVVRHTCWLARFNAPFAVSLLDRFAAAASPQIAGTPRTLWQPLQHAPDADVRLRGIRLAGTGRLR